MYASFHPLLDFIIDLFFLFIVEKHSKELIESLNDWEKKQKQQLEMLEEAENINLEMMLRYDHKVNLKKNEIIIALQEMLRLESVKLSLSDELKEFNQLEMRTKINQKVMNYYNLILLKSETEVHFEMIGLF